MQTQLKCQLSGSALRGQDRVFLKAVYALNPCLISGAASPGADSQGQELRIQMGVTQFTITLGPTVTLCSAGLEVLAADGGKLPPGDTAMIPPDWKLRLTLGHFPSCCL